MGHPPHEASSMVAFRNFNEEMKRPGVWEPEQGATSTVDNPRDNLDSLYHPPFHLMYQGPFDKTKQEAADHDKWLIVNLQSAKEFSSHMLNRDTRGLTKPWLKQSTLSSYFGSRENKVYGDTPKGVVSFHGWRPQISHCISSQTSKRNLSGSYTEPRNLSGSYSEIKRCTQDYRRGRGTEGWECCIVTMPIVKRIRTFKDDVIGCSKNSPFETCRVQEE